MLTTFGFAISFQSLIYALISYIYKSNIYEPYYTVPATYVFGSPFFLHSMTADSVHEFKCFDVGVHRINPEHNLLH